MDYSIVNGERIGSFHLGWSIEKLKEELKEKYIQEELENHYTIKTSTMKFWVLKENKTVSQIMTFGQYKGQFINGIGIGTNLSQINDKGIKWCKEDYVYTFPDYPGICFELEDIDEWDESLAPIEFISIFFP